MFLNKKGCLNEKSETDNQLSRVIKIISQKMKIVKRGMGNYEKM